MGLTVGVKARLVGNARSLLHSHVLPVSDTDMQKCVRDYWRGFSLCEDPEAESDGFLFVRVSLTKCLKRANESGAYPAKLLLDGAESAQIFYDTPVMRFYIDPTAVCGIARCSSPSCFFLPAVFILPCHLFRSPLCVNHTVHRQVVKRHTSLKHHHIFKSSII